MVSSLNLKPSYAVSSAAEKHKQEVRIHIVGIM